MYNKINIVESKNPPTNKNDWWYDLNDGVLKRFSGGRYNSVVGEGGNTPEVSWVPVPNLYANIPSNTILIFTVDDLTQPIISLYSDGGYTIESKEYDHEIGAWIITFSTDITEIQNRLFELTITNTFGGNAVVVFPQSLKDIHSGGMYVRCNSDHTALVFTSEYLDVENGGIIDKEAFSCSDTHISITTYSRTRITATIPIVDDEDEPVWSPLIYVQPSLLEEYQNTPIDEMCTIKPIE